MFRPRQIFFPSHMSLREQIRTWLIDESVGLIDTAELVARADRAIAESPDPPAFLIAVSLGEPLRFEPRLDLIKEPMGAADLVGLALRVLEALQSAEIDVDQVAAIATRVPFPRDADAAAAWSEFDWISDELELVRVGVKDETGVADRIADALRRAGDARGG